MKTQISLLFLGLALGGCVTSQDEVGSIGSQAPAYSQGMQSGMASHYSMAGHRTASGQMANPYGMTAAHRTLPFGTVVRVTNTRSGRSTLVTINDRGPFVRGRVIDLTTSAAREIGFVGVAPVTIEVVERPQNFARR